MNLFEYQNKLPFTGQIDDLESFLDDIWKRREVNSLYETEDALKSELQRFLQISHKTKEIKSNKYVGVIHYNSCKINLLPKIFYDPQKEYDDNGITGIQKHILWYLSYCRKIRFPHYDCTLGRFQNDFFEILIYMFAKYSHETLNSILYHQYAEMNEDLGYVRGKLNVKKYVSENIVKARWHRLNCDFETFTMDNKFNRIVKYVCKLLLNETRNDDSKKYLREILFILEDVSDERATPEESGRIQFNPIFADLETIRDYCTLFLSHSIALDYKNSLKLFAFLIPMEYLFEDFIFGFMDKRLPHLDVKPQKSSVSLDDRGIFTLRPDLLVTFQNQQFIADTKYKIIYSDDTDPKKGVSQNDLYQMVAYAIRYNIKAIVLIYPSTIAGCTEKHEQFLISDMFSGVKIQIKIYQVPIINQNIFETNNSELLQQDLKTAFNYTSNLLKQKLSTIFSLA